MSEPLRYSELTDAMLAVLRLEASLEDCYPQNGTRASQTLAGHAAWSRKGHLRSSVTDPGMTTNGTST